MLEEFSRCKVTPKTRFARFFFKREEILQAPTWTVVAISSVPWFATTVKGTFGVNAGGIVATVVSADLAFVYVWKKMLEKFSRRKQTPKNSFAGFSIFFFKEKKLCKHLPEQL